MAGCFVCRAGADHSAAQGHWREPNGLHGLVSTDLDQTGSHHPCVCGADSNHQQRLPPAEEHLDGLCSQGQQPMSVALLDMYACQLQLMGAWFVFACQRCCFLTESNCHLPGTIATAECNPLHSVLMLFLVAFNEAGSITRLV